jgi:hypothetical protein
MAGDTTKKVDRTHRRGALTLEDWKREHQKGKAALDTKTQPRKLRSAEDFGKNFPEDRGNHRVR